MTRTSPPTTSIRAQFSDEAGFTLIEMLVVLGVIILISLVVLPSVGSYFQLSLNSATRDLATTIKEAFNSASVTGKVHRVVYDLKAHSYWVESGPRNILVDTKESKENAERRKKFSRLSANAGKNEFSLEKTITRKKIALPRGVEFEDVVTQQSTAPITSGTAYTHFFPHGLTEKTIIHLKDQSKHHSSLVISALIGMTDVYDRYVNEKEVFTQ